MSEKEDVIRAACYAKLVNDYHYKPDHIDVEFSITMSDGTQRRLDIAVFGSAEHTQSNVKMIVEAKRQDQQTEEALCQLFGYLQAVESARFGALQCGGKVDVFEIRRKPVIDFVRYGSFPSFGEITGSMQHSVMADIINDEHETAQAVLTDSQPNSAMPTSQINTPSAASVIRARGPRTPNPPCLYCKSASTTKNGNRVGGKIYLCKSCGKHFTDSSIDRTKAKVRALQLRREGLTMRQISDRMSAEGFGSCSSSTVNYWVKNTGVQDVVRSELVKKCDFRKAQLEGANALVTTLEAKLEKARSFRDKVRGELVFAEKTLSENLARAIAN